MSLFDITSYLISSHYTTLNETFFKACTIFTGWSFRGSFGSEFNPSESELFQNSFPNQSEKEFMTHLMKIRWKSICLIPNESESNRIHLHLNRIFKTNHSDLGFIHTDSDWKYGSAQPELEFIWLDSDWIRLIFNCFAPNKIQNFFWILFKYWIPSETFRFLWMFIYI